MSQLASLYKKLHRWPGLILSFILLYFALTGIVMNHRDWFSGVDVSRQWLPKDYRYANWNNAALKGSLSLAPDSVLVYGNVGIWLTDSTFSEFSGFSQGFPEGMDNRKIFDLHRTASGHLYAATLFGLYAFDPGQKAWKACALDEAGLRIVAVESRGDSVIAMSRSNIYTGASAGAGTYFRKQQLPLPEGFDHRITLFETLWQTHSGELFGLPGKLFVDLLGVVTAFLSVTGIIYFFFPGWLRRRHRRGKPSARIANTARWSLRWHNYVGAWTFVLLIVLFFTGMFLRPPLLIAISKARVAPIKYTHLHQPNPWYDKLRDITFDSTSGHWLVATSEGIFGFAPQNNTMLNLPYQPPVSVMGINTFEPAGNGAYLTGSFSGLFLWNPRYATVYNYVTGEEYRGSAGGRPVGDYKVTGTIRTAKGELYLVDYEQGAIPLWHRKAFAAMPDNVREVSGMSLWNLCLEIHTGRFFQGVLGMLYILIVPLSGLASIVVVISGYLLWRRKYRNRQADAG